MQPDVSIPASPRPRQAVQTPSLVGRPRRSSPPLTHNSPSLTSLCSTSPREQKLVFKADFRKRNFKHFRTHALLPVKPRDSEQYPLPFPAVESLGPQYFLKQSYSFNSIPPTSLKGRPCRGPRGTLLRCWNRTSVALRHSPWDWWVGCERWRAVAASRQSRGAVKGSAASARPTLRPFGLQMGRQALPQGSGCMDSRV